MAMGCFRVLAACLLLVPATLAQERARPKPWIIVAPLKNNSKRTEEIPYEKATGNALKLPGLEGPWQTQRPQRIDESWV